MQGYSVAIVGATGLVGQEIIKVLQQRHFPVASVRLLSSSASDTRIIKFGQREIVLQEVTSKSFRDIDITFFANSAETTEHFAQMAVDAGSLVIDLSSTYGINDDVPLVVPEVNAKDLKKHNGIVASPTSAAVLASMVLCPLHHVSPVKRAVLTTFHAVSGTGAAAMEELSAQSKHVLEGKSAAPHVFPHQIAFNILPEVDFFHHTGSTRQEWRLMHETRKVLGDKKIVISATSIRVPVHVSDAAAVHVELSAPTTVERVREALAGFPGLKVLDDQDVSLYPHPWQAAGHDEVFVGRIREDVAFPTGVALWAVVDNLRKGTALNAVQIAEVMSERGWI